MKNIIWKPVLGYEGYYEVSDTGLIRSVGRYQLFTRKPSKYSMHNDEIESLHKDGYGSFQIGKMLSNKYGYKRDSIRSYCSKFIRNSYQEILKIKRRMKSTMLRPNDNSNGYKFVNLSVENNTKQDYIHRIVAKAFIGNIPDGFEVNHLNKDKSDNRLCNLEIVTKRGNGVHKNKGTARSSEYPAVSWNKARRKWVGMFKHNRDSYYCGGFDSEKSAFISVVNRANELGIDLGKYYDPNLYL